MIHLWAFLFTFGGALILIPLIIKTTLHYGLVVVPRKDRWHAKPTSLLGGIGMFIPFLISILILIPKNRINLTIIVCSFLIFILGLIDDFYNLLPQIKLIFQILIATLIVLSGIYIKIIQNPIISIPLTIFWIVGITNAVNILDNMDGVSSGIAFVSALCIFLYALKNHIDSVPVFSIALAGSALGFLRYNFPPAKIFMGDCGSLFLGFVLSVVTILGTWKEATNLIATLITPLIFLIIPIFDTILVTFNRISNGQSPFKGGTDHSTHRLALLGLSERKIVLLLMGISAISGCSNLLLSNLSIYSNFVLIIIFVVFLIFFAIYLSSMSSKKKKIIDGFKKRKRHFSLIVFNKKQIVQILLDVIMINVAYVSSYLLKYEGVIDGGNLALIQYSLPLIVFIKIVFFYVFGLYRGDWNFISIADLIRIMKGTLAGSVGSILFLIFIQRFVGFSRAVFIIDLLLTFIFISGTRVFFRIFKEYFSSYLLKKGTPILIMGAGDGGVLLLREIKNNAKLNYYPIGFIDDDKEKVGKIINGLTVLGGRKKIPELVKKNKIEKIFISSSSIEGISLKDIIEMCDDLHVECKRINYLSEIELN